MSWTRLASTLGVASIVVTAPAQAEDSRAPSPGIACAAKGCEGAGCNASAHQSALELIRAQTFWSLPREHRATILAELQERGQPMPGATAQPAIPDVLASQAIPLTEAEFDDAWLLVKDFVARDNFESFSPIHQRMLANFAERNLDPDGIPAMPCFTGDSDPALIGAFDAVISYGISTMQEMNPIAFEQTTRWDVTALQPGGSSQGDPVTLTYSFPPDGTFIASGVGEPAGPNDLNAYLDGVYGSRAAWRALYDQIFAEWGALSGNTYVLEPNDDGVDLFVLNGQGQVIEGNSGIAGVRGDLRMSGKAIDGTSGTLGYNFFPPVGNMVIDTTDNNFLDLSNNSLFLRNVLSHEHGHGMGQLHTCPVTNSKLMEPFINLNFDGPQFDDILNAQRHYGDPLEPNDSPATASAVGSLTLTQSNTTTTVSLDDELDVDFYEVTLIDDARLEATLRTQGSLYQAGPQTNACTESQPYDPSQFLDPAIAILDGNGITVLALSDAPGAGGNETASVFVPAGTYYVRATGSMPAGDQIIAYELDITARGLAVTAPTGLPSSLTPGVPATFEIAVEPNGEMLVGSPTISYRAAGDATFTTVNLTPTDGSLYEVSLPAFECGDDPEFFLTATGDISGAINLPGTGSQTAIITDGLVTQFSDNGDTDLGYTVSGDAIDGQWTLGAPQANDRGDPAADFDGSGSAWLTDIDALTDNSDVDDGTTILTSPPLDLSNNSSVSFAYWFNDVSGGPISGGDTFTVEVSSDNGATYSIVRTYVSPAASWRTDTLFEGIDFSASAPGAGRLRFSVSDIGAQNVVEGGLDALVVTGAPCTNPPPPTCGPADITTTGATVDGQPGFGEPDGVVDLDDLGYYLNFWLVGDLLADTTTTGATLEGQPGFGIPDGSVSLDDLGFYLNLWLTGCP
ncbi:MAG: GC-type dockerin domain-anchored protein [Planctomycetota bacterium]